MLAGNLPKNFSTKRGENAVLEMMATWEFIFAKMNAKEKLSMLTYSPKYPKVPCYYKNCVTGGWDKTKFMMS